jgi:hypothetical protein
MNSDAYLHRKNQLKKVDESPAPYTRSVVIWPGKEGEQTFNLSISDTEYARIKDVLLQDWDDSFRLVIRTGNAAFDDKNAEVARILRGLADQIERGFTDIPYLYDANGNDVGEASFH